MNEMLLPGGAVQGLEQLKERLGEHCDTGQQWLREMHWLSPGADTSLMVLDSKDSPAGSPSLIRVVQVKHNCSLQERL